MFWCSTREQQPRPVATKTERIDQVPVPAPASKSGRDGGTGTSMRCRATRGHDSILAARQARMTRPVCDLCLPKGVRWAPQASVLCITNLTRIYFYSSPLHALLQLLQAVFRIYCTELVSYRELSCLDKEPGWRGLCGVSAANTPAARLGHSPEPEPPPTPSSESASSYDHDDSLDDNDSSDDWQPDIPDAVAPSTSSRYVRCAHVVILCLPSLSSSSLPCPCCPSPPESLQQPSLAAFRGPCSFVPNRFLPERKAQNKKKEAKDQSSCGRHNMCSELCGDFRSYSACN
ncbi:hypothetical protein VTN96DRAFT_8517 [Rasamsonia emersonii]